MLRVTEAFGETTVYDTRDDVSATPAATPATTAGATPAPQDSNPQPTIRELDSSDPEYAASAVSDFVGVVATYTQEGSGRLPLVALVSTASTLAGITADPVGRQQVVDLNKLTALAKRVGTVVDSCRGLALSDACALSTPTLRIVRNLCAATPETQSAFAACGGVGSTLSLCARYVAALADTPAEVVKTVKLNTALLTVLQTLGNCCVSGDEARPLVWAGLFGGGGGGGGGGSGGVDGGVGNANTVDNNVGGGDNSPRPLLELSALVSVAKPKAVAAAAMIVANCVCNSDPCDGATPVGGSTAPTSRVHELAGSLPLLLSLFSLSPSDTAAYRSPTLPPDTPLCAEGVTATVAAADAADTALIDAPSSAWMVECARALFSADALPTALTSLTVNLSESVDADPATHARASQATRVLFKLLDALTSEKTALDAVALTPPATRSLLASVVCAAGSHLDEEEDTPTTTITSVAHVLAAEPTVTILTFKIVGSVAACGDTATRAELLSLGVLAGVAGVLNNTSALPSQLHSRSTAVRGEDAERLAESVDAPPAEYGLKRDLVRIIANMCHLCRPCQDEVRELGLIPVVLNLTRLDALNPFIREWAIFAISAIVFENAENEAEVSALHAQDVASNEEIAAMGVEAELDESGRLRFTQQPPPPHARS